ncbi:Unknown protein sequence [Pseudomonas syringae pv. maculicola]|nr:Unknown protein sequence [Pseudomonas syringae pv. maculicola]
MSLVWLDAGAAGEDVGIERFVWAITSQIEGSGSYSEV